MTPDEIVDALGMQKLDVEGGLWSQSWRDEAASAIYYLLAAPEFSAVHRLDRLEIFSYHAGAAARMILLHPDGRVERPVLGADLAAGQRPQVAVPAGVWQACETLGEWTLLGTFVSPPYTEDCVDFGLADALAREYPDHADQIRPLCRF